MDANREEYNQIFRHILSKPQYWVLMGYKSMEATARQFASTDIDGSYELPWVNHLEGTPTFEAVRKYIPHELNALKHSRQNGKALGIVYYDRIFALMLAVSSMLALFCYKRPEHQAFARLVLWVCLFIVLNAFVTATFANVLTRLHSRVVWLLPLVNVVLIRNYIAVRFGAAPPLAK